MGHGVTVISVNSAVVVGAVDSVCIVIWRGAVTPPDFARQRAGLAEVVAAATDGADFLCIVEPSSSPPNAELRKASAEMVAGHGEKLNRIAVVIEGSGMKAALARTVLSGIGLLWADRKATNAYFSNVPDAAAWIAGRGALQRTQAIADAAEELRAGLDQVSQSESGRSGGSRRAAT